MQKRFGVKSFGFGLLCPKNVQGLGFRVLCQKQGVRFGFPLQGL